MKRIKSQYLLQTFHFFPDPKEEKSKGLKEMEKEISEFKANLDANIKVVKETKREDETILLKIKKKIVKTDKEKQE